MELLLIFYKGLLFYVFSVRTSVEISSLFSITDLHLRGKHFGADSNDTCIL